MTNGLCAPALRSATRWASCRAFELGLLPVQSTLGLGNFHAVAGAPPNQIGLEVGDHGQHVEQQPPHRIGQVVHRAAEAELYLPAGEVLDDFQASGRTGRVDRAA